MVISQLPVYRIELNKFHFVDNLIAFKMITKLTSDYYFNSFLGDENPIVQFFSDTVCTR